MQTEPDSTHFRDRIATVDGEGRRKWIFAVQPKGKFYRWRTIVSYLYFLLFFGLPFVQLNGRPLFLFNIPSAKFILFGKVFWPQDFFIFGLGMITFIFFVILFTAAFGRLFCGWVCPQTIFMEMLFRKVEYLVMGSAAKQKMMRNAPWTKEKMVRTTAKHVFFFLLSFVIANFFLAYIIGIRELEKIITEPVSQHVVGLSAIMLFSTIFYAVYAFFREQACTVVCPYGRLQGVLVDKNTMAVAYDHTRGEPRHAFTKKENAFGDCVDCFQCVKVCPTGIDIRNGIQMECVGCTACIDACDTIMEKTGRPTGLIRYTSENMIAKGEKLHYTSRMKLYTGLCLLALVLLSCILVSRKEIDATIMRTPGILYQERGADSLSNLYQVKVVNKTMQDVPLTIRMEDGEGKVELVGGHAIHVPKEGVGSGAFFVVLPKTLITQRKTLLRLAIYQGDEKIAVIKTNFLGYTGG